MQNTIEQCCHPNSKEFAFKCCLQDFSIISNIEAGKLIQELKTLRAGFSWGTSEKNAIT